MSPIHARRRTVEALLANAERLGLSAIARRRLQWFLFALKHRGNVSLTCRHFAIARSTFLRWARRFRGGDPSTLEDAPRAPHTVRAPETPLAVVELIRRMREVSPLCSKEHIAALLAAEYGVAISASTVGRVIRRHKFFFADSRAHREKRDDRPRGGACEVRWTIGGFAMAVAALAVTFFAGTASASAAQSDSFTLYDQFPNDATDIQRDSASFTMEEDETTWRKVPLYGSNFQILPPLAAAAQSQTSSSAASSSSAGGGDGGGGDGGGGGRRSLPSSIATTSSSRARTSSVRSEVPASSATSSIPPASSASSVPSIDDILDRFGPTGVGDRFRFFDAVDPVCPDIVAHAAAGERGVPMRWFVLAILTTAFLTSFVMHRLFVGGARRLWMLLPLGFVRRRAEDDEKKKTKKKKTSARMTHVAVAIVAVASLYGAATATAATTAPQSHVYNGRLLDASGDPITSAHDIRFSYWHDADSVAGDVTGTGAINAGAANYAGWHEVHTVTPDASGYFSVELGSVTPLPAMNGYSPLEAVDLFLQVEVKADAAADTAYELLDVDPASTTVDRSPILSVPFTLNADMLDLHDVGTGSGSIPVLQSGGLLPVSTVPGATNQDSFTIDADGDSQTATLTFGGSLLETLSFSNVDGRFSFSDDVHVEGNLTVSGLINGIDISSLGTETGTYLRASSGGGLNLRVSQGSYRLNGNVVNFAGSSAVVLPASSVSNVFFTATGMTVTTGGFPTDKSFIPVATVTTSAGAITSIDDRRVLSSDNRERTVEELHHPDYEGAVYQGDGTSNVGTLTVTHDNISLNNYYAWTTTKSSAQDYGVVFRATLSPDFVRWKDNPLSFDYRSTSDNVAENALSVQVFDTNGSPVTLSGSVTDLADTSWTTAQAEWTGMPTWTPGQEYLIKFTVTASGSYQMHLGSLKLQYIDIIDE